MSGNTSRSRKTRDMAEEYDRADSGIALPEDVPVTMPVLPPKLIINSAQQFKAIGDPLRGRILSIIQNQPATAKQIAERLKTSHGTIGHHLQVLEAAGLAQVVARRLVHGIVAKYYTRTARIFVFELPRELAGNTSISLKIMTDARDEYAEALMSMREEDLALGASFPHARLSTERARAYNERLDAIIDDFIQETPDPNGQVYGLSVSLFKAPAYMQSSDSVQPSESQSSHEL